MMIELQIERTGLKQEADHHSARVFTSRATVFSASLPRIGQSAFARVEHTAFHTLDLRVMRKHMDASVAPAKKGA